MESYPDRFVRREVAALKVTCINAGCGWNGNLECYDDHVNSCPFRPIRCGNDGCNRDVAACHLAHHEQQECCHGRVMCQYCNSPETMGSLQDHLDICPDVPVRCANCGIENIPRGQLSCHKDPVGGECAANYCPFRKYGCTCDELMSRQDLNRHLTEGFSAHLLLLVRLLEGGSHQNQEQAAAPEGSVRQVLRSAEAEIEAHSWALSTHYRRLGELDDELRTLVDALAGVAEGIQQVNNTNAAQMQEISALRNRVDRLEVTVQRQDATINDLLQLVRAVFRYPQLSSVVRRV